MKKQRLKRGTCVLQACRAFTIAAAAGRSTLWVLLVLEVKKAVDVRGRKMVGC